MRFARLLPLVALCPVLACSADGTAPGEIAAEGQEKPASLEQRASYAIGFNLGSALKEQGVEADLPYIRQGVADGLKGDSQLLSDEEMQSTMTEFQSQIQERQAKLREEQGSVNEEKGKAFLTDNASREGVQTTASGLQYEIVEQGNGPKPTAADTVTVHYRGTLIDGKQFDSSYDRGQPATFPLNRVIPGWTEGLQLMNVGSKYKLFIPSELGYGANGAGADIGPHATLIFDVELIGIEGR